MARIDLATQFTDVRERVSTQPTTPLASALEGPKYRRLTRKETLLRPDQLADLAALARFRMKHRRVRTERITENTLVRIAIDLLLDNQDLLEGSTETELSNAILGAVARLADRPPTAASQSTVPESHAASRLPEFVTPGLATSDTPEARDAGWSR